MNFKVAPEPFEKLKLIDDATRFEPAGMDPQSESVTTEHQEHQRTPKPLPCISQVTTAEGQEAVCSKQ